MLLCVYIASTTYRTLKCLSRLTVLVKHCLKEGVQEESWIGKYGIEIDYSSIHLFARFFHSSNAFAFDWQRDEKKTNEFIKNCCKSHGFLLLLLEMPWNHRSKLKAFEKDAQRNSSSPLKLKMKNLVSECEISM